MDAFIDLSYIFKICVSSVGFWFVNCLISEKISMKSILIYNAFSFVLYSNFIFFGNNTKTYNIIFMIISFYLIYKKRLFKGLFFYIFSYYSIVSICRIFTNEIYFFCGLLLLNSVNGMRYIYVPVLFYLLFFIIIKNIKSFEFFKKYRFKVKLFIGNKEYYLDGYFDSGNTFKYKNLPVVFLVNKLKNNEIKYEKMMVEGIGYSNSDYCKGEIVFKDNKKDVYFAYVNKKTFNGCDCLLNVYLL
jgi:hypothetical protein